LEFAEETLIGAPALPPTLTVAALVRCGCSCDCELQPALSTPSASISVESGVSFARREVDDTRVVEGGKPDATAGTGDVDERTGTTAEPPLEPVALTAAVSEEAEEVALAADPAIAAPDATATASASAFSCSYSSM